ncbi:MAG TPA: hypothetical protein VMN04_06890, partial [Thermoanaerobaculia bacterium]|nr:hypothetical protein [Thermoanaerobaculia bacterium]
MNRRALFAALALALSGAGAARAADAPKPQRILVLDLASSGVDPALARNLSEVFTLAVRKALPKAVVIGQADVNAMLQLEKQKDL